MEAPTVDGAAPDAGACGSAAGGAGSGATAGSAGGAVAAGTGGAWVVGAAGTLLFSGSVRLHPLIATVTLNMDSMRAAFTVVGFNGNSL